MADKNRPRNMVNQMTLSASVPGTGTLTNASASAGRDHGHDLHDPLSGETRDHGGNDSRARATRHDLDDHSHDLGLAVVGLDAPAARVTTVRESIPRTEPSAPPAAIAAFEAAGELLRALAAPVRIAIVVRLGAGPQCVHDLVESTGAPQPLISQHLRVLRGAGVVRGVRRGREIAYSLTDEHIGHIVADAISHAREAR
jgi:DNA-binding transcriptional ArsR family regulator